MLSLYIFVYGIIYLDTLGINLTIIRPLTTVIYFLVIPGFIVLKILNLNKITNLDTILFSVGLSISILMFLGLLTNLMSPVFGFDHPISLIPFINAFTIFLIFLLALCYCCSKSLSIFKFKTCRSMFSPYLLFACLLPLLAIFGTYLVNFYFYNHILVFLLLILTFIPILYMFRNVSSVFYPPTIFLFALAILYHNSLISIYLVEWGDLSLEYHYSYQVLTTSFWNSGIHNNLNSMMSITMLPPILSLTTGLELMWVYKIVYPILYSLVPLGIYRISQLQTNDKIAFLASILFISSFTFFTVMLGASRQQIGEIFLILLTLILVNKDIDTLSKSILSIILSFSLIISHYGLSYIYDFVMLNTILLILIKNLPLLRDFLNNYMPSIRPLSLKDNSVKFNTILFFNVVILCWYIYTSRSAAFNVIVFITHGIINSISSDFLNPNTIEGLALLISPPSTWLGAIYKALYYFTQAGIIVGIIYMILNNRKYAINVEYLAFSIGAMSLLAAAILIPMFSAIGTGRMYHIAQIYLSMYSVIGGLFILEKMVNLLKSKWVLDASLPAKVLSILFSLYFMLNCGLAYQLAGIPVSFSLNTNMIDRPHFESQEIIAGTWLNDKQNHDLPIYSDLYNAHIFSWFTGDIISFRGKDNVIMEVPDKSYIFLGKRNLVKGEIFIEDPIKIRAYFSIGSLHNSSIYQKILSRNNIFNNRDAKIYI